MRSTTFRFIGNGDALLVRGLISMKQDRTVDVLGDSIIYDAAPAPQADLAHHLFNCGGKVIGPQPLVRLPGCISRPLRVRKGTAD